MALKYYFKNYTDNSTDTCACLMTTVNTQEHTHIDFYEIILITCGGYYNICDGTRTLYKKNSLLFFRPTTSHSIIMSEPNSSHFTFLVSRDFMHKEFSAYFPDTASPDQRDFFSVNLTYTQTDYLYSLANSLINIQFNDKSQLHRLFLHNTLYLLFSAMNNSLINEQDGYIDSLIERLNNFHYVNTDVSSIYLDYPISQSTLCAAFKKRTGTTIVNYRNTKKLEYAAHLLSDWNNNITNVASKLNISCLSYFSKQFKAHYGMSPKEFQRTHRKPFPKE